MRFRFRALAADGQLVLGETDAAGPEAVDALLALRGLELITASPARPVPWRRQAHWPNRELIDLCFHLEQLCGAGVPLHEALDELSKASEHPTTKRTLAAVTTAIAGGQPLSQALANAPTRLPAHVPALIRAGENGGCLPEILRRLGQALRSEDELRAQGRRALLYPAFVGATVLTALAFLTVVLLPQLKQFVVGSGQALPLHARLLFGLAEILQRHGAVALAALTGLVCIGALAVHRSGRCRRGYELGKLRLPLYGQLIVKAELARFAGTLALLYSAGIPVLDALKDSTAVLGNGVLRDAAANVGRRISEGSRIGAAFAAAGIFPPLLIRMLQVGESTGRVDETLEHVAHFYRRDVEETSARINALAEPTLTLILGLLLGWIVLAALGPIYDFVGRGAV